MDPKDGCEEIKTYITSEDTMIVKEYKNIIQEDLYSSRGASLLDTLIECFMQTKSKRLIELLVGINDSLCMVCTISPFSHFMLNYFYLEAFHNFEL